MVLANLVHEGFEQPYSDFVSSFVVVAIAWEVTFGLIVLGKARLIAYNMHLGILDCTDRINHMAEACNTRCERTTHICVDKSHFGSLIEVLIVHVMDKVQCLHIDARKPVKHIIKAWHELFIGNHIGCNGAISRAYLLASATVDTAVNGIKHCLGKVGTRSEELHFLTCLRSTDTATYRIVITPNRSHHIVIFILNGTCCYRNLGCIVAETFRKSAAVEHREIGFGRWSHVFEGVKEAEIILRYH